MKTKGVIYGHFRNELIFSLTLKKDELYSYLSNLKNKTLLFVGISIIATCYFIIGVWCNSISFFLTSLVLGFIVYFLNKFMKKNNNPIEPRDLTWLSQCSVNERLNYVRKHDDIESLRFIVAMNDVPIDNAINLAISASDKESIEIVLSRIDFEKANSDLKIRFRVSTIEYGLE